MKPNNDRYSKRLFGRERGRAKFETLRAASATHGLRVKQEQQVEQGRLLNQLNNR